MPPLFAVDLLPVLAAVGPFFVAFATALGITGLELITVKYPRTWFVVVKDWVWLYIALYGLLSLAGLWSLDWLVSADKIKLEGLGLSSVWIKALYVGIGVKALLHINVAKFGTTPIGSEIIVKAFEPGLLRTILLNEFIAVRAYVAPYAARHTELGNVRAKIIDNIPPTLPAEERAAFQNDVNGCAAVTAALELALRFLGRRIFQRIFPL